MNALMRAVVHRWLNLGLGDEATVERLFADKHRESVRFLEAIQGKAPEGPSSPALQFQRCLKDAALIVVCLPSTESIYNEAITMPEFLTAIGNHLHRDTIFARVRFLVPESTEHDLSAFKSQITGLLRWSISKALSRIDPDFEHSAARKRASEILESRLREPEELSGSDEGFENVPTPRVRICRTTESAKPVLDEKLGIIHFIKPDAPTVHFLPKSYRNPTAGPDDTTSGFSIDIAGKLVATARDRTLAWRKGPLKYLIEDKRTWKSLHPAVSSKSFA